MKKSIMKGLSALCLLALIISCSVENRGETSAKTSGNSDVVSVVPEGESE